MDDGPDLGSSLRQVGATLIEIAQTRLELGTVELAEERERLAGQLLAAVVTVVGLSVGGVLGVLGLAWWVGPPGGALVLGAAAGAALLAAAMAVRRWRGIARSRPALLQETLTQLRCDARTLKDGAAS